MSALLTSPIVLAIGGIIIAFVVGLFKGSLSGAAKERAKQDAERIKARDIADDVQNDIGAMPPDDARAEMKKWSPKH